MTTPNEKPAKVRIFLIAAAVLFIGGFLLGFVPQSRTVSRLEDDLRVRDERIAQFEREAKLSKGRELAGLLYLELTRKNYGVAAQHATTFFNHVRAMMNDTSPEMKNVLENILSQRDALVSGIAKPDPAAEILARDVLDRLHNSAAPGTP